MKKKNVGIENMKNRSVARSKNVEGKKKHVETAALGCPIERGSIAFRTAGTYPNSQVIVRKPEAESRKPTLAEPAA
jgi:hypothetical protein